MQCEPSRKNYKRGITQRTQTKQYFEKPSAKEKEKAEGVKDTKEISKIWNDLDIDKYRIVLYWLYEVYTNITRWGNQLLLREYVDGQRLNRRIKYLNTCILL